MLDGASSRLEKQQSKKVLKELKSVLKVKEKEFQVSCFIIIMVKLHINSDHVRQIVGTP